MQAQAKLVFKSSGFRKILMSDGVTSAITAQGHRIAAASGRKCSVHAWPGGYGGGRMICSVITSSRDDGDVALFRAV